MDDLKEDLKLQCLAILDGKLATTTHRIQSLQKDLDSETKSSAGDKHETGRAMIQLEMEKESQKLKSFVSMKATLDRMDTEGKSTAVRLGSLVTTSISNYFISASLGELQVHGKTYYAISVHSPIGQLLLGKKVGAELVFNGRKIQINDIA